MKRFVTSIVILILGATLLVSCGAAYAISPVLGALYTDVKAPLTATSHTGSSKVGTAGATSILGIIATGDASINAAAKSAGITKISYIDYHTMSILGIYAKYTVYVYGE